MQLDLQKKMMMQQLEEQKQLLEQERARVSEQKRQGQVSHKLYLYTINQ